MDNFITLTWLEVMRGAMVGVQRQVACLRRGEKGWERCDHDLDWQNNIEGAIAELAVAKFMGRYWPGTVDRFKDPDLTNDIQVRQAPKPSDSLIVRPRDNIKHRFVLAIGIAPTYNVIGWINGEESKEDPSWWRNPGDKGWAWFVPQSKLRPMDTFPNGQ